MKRLTSSQSTDNPCSTNGGVDDRNNFVEFGLKGRVEICAASDRTETETVCEFGEDSDVAVVFELETWDRRCLSSRLGGVFGTKGYARVAMAYAL